MGSRMRAASSLLFASVLLVLAVAGCLGGADGPVTKGSPTKKSLHGSSAPEWKVDDLNAPLSIPRFPATAILKEDVWHTSWDGTQLHSRVFRPAEAGPWKSPIILHMSPYFGPNSAATGTIPTNNASLDGWLVTFFVPRGYAVVLNDVRGTGESGGCLEQTGPKQTKDGYKVVEDLAALPWSNGKVGMIGISYDGETQQSTATAHPPHLTTIVPMSSVAGQYEWNFYDGIPYTTNGIAGMVSYMQIGVTPPKVPPNEGAKPANYVQRWDCHPENLKEGADPRGDLDAYWQEREIRTHVKDIQNTSVLYTHGLEDWNVKPNHIRDWFNDIPTAKHAWIGQWMHNYPDRNTFKKEWSRSDWRLTVHRWFDQWLLGVETGIMDEPSVQIMDSMGRWRFEDAWPPLNPTVTTFYLSGDGRLLPAAPKDGAVGYQDLGISMEDPRAQSVSFVSDPIAADLHYAGWPLLNVTASLDRPGTHFAVHLIDVAPDGTEKIINRGYLDAQHRNALTRSDPVPTGQAITYQIRFFPQDDVVQAGHKIKVRLGAMDGWIQPDGTMASVRVALGASKTFLTFPIIDDATARFFEPLKVEQ